MLFHVCSRTFQLHLKTSISPKPINQNLKMALAGVHLLYPKILPKPIKFQTNPFPSTTHLINLAKPQISCTSSTNDGELSSDLASEVEKMNTHLLQREEAMKKSRQLLFTELCQYLGLRPEELKKKWKEMDEEDKGVLVKGFVSEWGVNFHPLSARSVKEMVEEHLAEDNPPPHSSSPSILFPGLKKIMGFAPNK